MAEKTPAQSNDASDADKELERRVDAMMDDSPQAPEPYADKATDALVDDIVVKDSDKLLAHDPAGTGPAEPVVGHGGSDRPGLKHLLKTWWHNKPARYGTAAALLALVVAAGSLPATRYYALNTVGVRSATSLTVIDKDTLLPLKNVSVEVGDHRAKSNQDGLVKLSGVQLGPQALTISQAGFATITRTVTLGLGSNPLGEFTLQPVGKQFRFKLVDYLSGKPVGGAEISRGDANAKADKNGQIVLTIDQNDTDADQATIKADGYRSERVSLEEGAKQSQAITMVTAKKAVFVSKQSGTFDLYKMDIDGKNKKLLLAGTGHEDADITVVQNASGTEAAIVSRRDDFRNQDGYRLQNLTIVNIEKGTVLKLDQSEQIRLIDWIGDRLVYVKIKAGTSAGNPERYQLVSYDYRAVARNQLASANYFNDIVSVRGSLYYAASNNFQGGASQFAVIKPDNTGRKVLLDKTEIWNISRSGYDTLTMTSLQGTYQYKVGDPDAKKTSAGNDTARETRFYVDRQRGDEDENEKPETPQALWTDVRDGKGVLLSYGGQPSKDTVIATQVGLTSPIRWLDSRTVIYRVATPAETADYAVSLDGGEPKKVTDLTHTAGFGAWNYR